MLQYTYIEEEVKDERAVALVRWTSEYATLYEVPSSSHDIVMKALSAAYARYMYMYRLLGRIFICQNLTVTNAIAIAAMLRLPRFPNCLVFRSSVAHTRRLAGSPNGTFRTSPNPPQLPRQSQRPSRAHLSSCPRSGNSTPVHLH